ncbi:MAG: hypothetical protein AAGA56_22590 [Myxococcota bacterium]
MATGAAPAARSVPGGLFETPSPQPVATAIATTDKLLVEHHRHRDAIIHPRRRTL